MHKSSKKYAFLYNYDKKCDHYTMKKNSNISFKSNRIKELRTERGLTQSQLAFATGIKQSNISRWEANLTLPNILDCWRLASFFDVSVDDLIGKAEY
jgi:DNA-binding XRE family transcriptional regulator